MNLPTKNTLQFKRIFVPVGILRTDLAAAARAPPKGRTMGIVGFSLARLAQLCSFLTVFNIRIYSSILIFNIVPDDIEAQHLSRRKFDKLISNFELDSEDS